MRVQRDVINWGVFLASGRYNGAFIRGMRESGPAVINLLQGAAIGTAFHEKTRATATLSPSKEGPGDARRRASRLS